MCAQRRFRPACALAQSDPIAKAENFLRANSEDSEQTARTHRLVCVFIVRIRQKVRFLKFRFICQMPVSMTGRGHSHCYMSLHSPTKLKAKYARSDEIMYAPSHPSIRRSYTRPEDRILLLRCSFLILQKLSD